MQHSAHTESGRRQDRVPLAVGIDLRGLQPGWETSDELADESALGAADGLNVSIGGIAMRAPVAPPPGTLLECSFQCPPTGELVCAQGEVMWSEQSGPEQGAFGMRFVELDTKSATALRRFVAPAAREPVKIERARAVSLRIDGLAAPVEAELKLSDDSRLVLELPLSFLPLGRSMEVTLPGRGKERGRLASVELRHTHFDVPTLVFGVLLDGAPERLVAAVPEHVAQLFVAPEPEDAAERALEGRGARDGESDAPVLVLASARMRDRLERVADAIEAEQPGSEQPEPVPEASEPGQGEPELPVERSSQVPAALAFELPIERASQLPAAAAAEAHELAASSSQLQAEASPHTTQLELRVSRPSQPRYSELPSDVHDDELSRLTYPSQLRGLPSSAEGSAPPFMVDDTEVAHQSVEELDQDQALNAVQSVRASTEAEPESELSLRVRNLPAHLRELFRSPGARLSDLRQRIEPALREQAEYFDLPDAKSRFLLSLARLRSFLLQGWSKVDRSTSRTSPRAQRALRMQRSTLLGLGPAEPERTEPSRVARTVAIAFAVVGMGLGVYALAPRSGADRIKLPERVDGVAEATALEAVAGKDELDLVEDGPELVPEPKRTPQRAARDVVAHPEPAPAEGPGVEHASSAPFGAAEVPNGRVFTLRMNGPVTLIEGEARENGLTVRIPGRQAIDRASPIATSHTAVARAMILNRGGYAELTIDFAPGVTPRYQVRGKGDALEVTLERL